MIQQGKKNAGSCHPKKHEPAAGRLCQNHSSRPGPEVRSMDAYGSDPQPGWIGCLSVFDR